MSDWYEALPTANLQGLELVEQALEQAQDCIRGETPEDITDEEAKEDTIRKIRDAMRALASLRPWAAETDRLKAQIARVARNRDMWKGQCGRQAERLREPR